MDRCGTLDESGIGQSSGNGMRRDDQRQYFTERVERHGLCLETHTIQFKKKRDPERFEQAQHDIAELIKQAEAGAIELAYIDEAGFAPQPPNRSAWTRSGEVHAVTAKRGQRLNVIGALLSSGSLMLAKLWQSVNGLWFFGFLMALIEHVAKPLVVILDNASIHTAKKLKPYWDLLEEKGLRFYFLPPYSPELNRIEMLWHKMKYEWLPFKTFTPDELEQAIDEIGIGFGSKYMLTFC
jgi:transposase